MQSRDFCFWLQGFFELSGDATAISTDQTTIMSRHLELVFKHEIQPLAKAKPSPDTPRSEPAPPAPTPQPEPPPDERQATEAPVQTPRC
jgi:hypothetical protein